MGWQTTMTKQGLEILAGLGGGNPIVSAWAGTGTVPAEELQEQTGLVNPIRKIPIIEDGQLGGKRFYRLQVTNADVEDGYEINQFGIFVSFDGQPPKLYFIAQNADGDIVPSKNSVKGFIAEYKAALVFSISSEPEPEPDGGDWGFITPDALDARLEFFKQGFIQEPMTPEDIDEICTVEALPPKFPDFTGDISDDDIDNIFNL